MFDIRQEAVGSDGCELCLSGELDVAGAPHLRRTTAELIGSGCRHLVVDLADTRFMDSSGLGALVWAAQRLQAVGGDVKLTHPQGEVMRALEVSHLDEYFEVTS